MMGVKETGELVVWLAKAGSAVGQSIEDGKVDWTDAPKLLALLPSAPSAFLGAAQIPAELKDMDAAEASMLVTLFAEEFDLADDEAEKKVEMIISALAQIYAVIIGLKDLQK